METQRHLASEENIQAPHIGVAGEICCGIRTILQEARSLVSGTPLMPAQVCARLQDETERFALWVDSFAATSGRLDDILRKSKELRTVVMTLLYDLSQVICDGFTESRLFIPPSRLLHDELNDLHLLAEKLPHSLGFISEAADGLSDDDEIPPNLDETLDDLEFYIDSLMDLSPALDKPLTDLDLDDSLSLPIETYDVGSLAAQVFCRKIRDRFPSVDKRLVERLGEANADRALVVKSIGQASVSEDDASEALFSASGPSRSGTRTSSQPGSIFDKPAYLKPIPEDAQSFATLASLASFKTTPSDVVKGRPRVPPFPETRSVSGLVQCYVCQHKLAASTSRVAWQKHVFGDLKPYVCTREACKSRGQLWGSSLLWARHEESHGPLDPKVASCPFCSARPPVDNINNHYKHVAKHLREISLAALPLSMEYSNEDSTTDDDSSSVDLEIDTPNRDHSAPGIDADAALPTANLEPRSENDVQFTSRGGSFRWKRGTVNKTPVLTGARAPFHAPAPPPGWVQERVSAYNLRWQVLRAFLIKLFAREEAVFQEQQAVHEDWFVFYTPRKLTKVDKEAIDDLRFVPEATRHPVRRSNSPDPGIAERDALTWD